MPKLRTSLSAAVTATLFCAFVVLLTWQLTFAPPSQECKSTVRSWVDTAFAVAGVGGGQPIAPLELPVLCCITLLEVELFDVAATAAAAARECSDHKRCTKVSAATATRGHNLLSVCGPQLDTSGPAVIE